MVKHSSEVRHDRTGNSYCEKGRRKECYFFIYIINQFIPNIHLPKEHQESDKGSLTNTVLDNEC